MDSLLHAVLTLLTTLGASVASASTSPPPAYHKGQQVLALCHSDRVVYRALVEENIHGSLRLRMVDPSYAAYCNGIYINDRVIPYTAAQDLQFREKLTHIFRGRIPKKRNISRGERLVVSLAALRSSRLASGTVREITEEGYVRLEFDKPEDSKNNSVYFSVQEILYEDAPIL